MKFEDFTNDTMPYMYHCHILMHEDDGMMGQFLVVDSSSSGVNNLQPNETINIYPNPVNDYLRITIDDVRLNNTIQIYDLLGRQICTDSTLQRGLGGFEIDVHKLTSGIYFLKITTNNKIFNTKFIKQ